jgi:predicted O-linked N-acetylglucosamine transferase (SPINDLY family)
MLDVISAHDKDKFSVHLISLCEAQHHDKTTAAFRAVADAFLDVSSLDDLNAAKVIAEADLDVLVDLAGHTMAARPGIYALRPASKIVTHLGYHGCLGMSAVDYKFTDAIADDASSTAFQIEKPFYLDGCLFPFTHVASTAEDNAKYHRDEAGCAQEFVFATFVSVLKMSPRCLVAWRQIMEAVPNAVLAFSPVYANDEISIRRAIASVGIDDVRLRFIPAGSSDGEQRARYQLVDAVLDTFPYAGGDTTLAALDRDVPVITLRGKRGSEGAGGRNAERVGASILTHLGITDTICENEQEYIECAIRVAQDKALHSSLRNRIAAARKHSVMGIVASHTKSLERAYVQIAAEGIQRLPSALTAEQFFQRFNAALKIHEATRDEKSKVAVAEEYASLEVEQPAYLPLLKISAILAGSRGLVDEAMHFLQQVLMAAPADAESAIALATLQSDLHADDVALSTIATALQTCHKNAALLTSLLVSQARILLRLDRADDALHAADRAISISPADSAANFIRANALAELGEAALALQAYGRVLSQAPAQSEAACSAAYNAALISFDRGDMVTAETLFRRVINTDAKHELAHIKLAQALKTQKKTDAWISLAKRVAAEFPDSARGKLLRAETRRFEQDLAGESREISLLAKALCIEPDHFLVEELAQPILHRVAAIDLPESLTESLASRYLTALNAIYRHDLKTTKHDMPTAAKLAGGIKGTLGGTIKIGFLVEHANLNNARQQQVNEFARSFENNNSTLILYTLANDVEQAIKANQSAVDASHPQGHPRQADSRQRLAVTSLAGLGAVRAAQRIRQDSPDVLIDLVGYRHALAPPIMFQKPARMQLVNGAFANVFDCEAIDFEIFDQWTAPPKWKENGPSRPVMRLRSVTSDACPAVAPISNEAATLTLTSTSAFLFAIGTTASEISLDSARLWKSILDQVPNAMLAVPAQNDADLRSYHDVLRAGGIGSTRITQCGANTTSRFASIHAVLDTVGVSDATVATEALAAGVAVIALRGPTAKERMAYSVLARGGLTELVADSGPDYIALAAKYARNAAFGANLKTRLTSHAARGAADKVTDGEVGARHENQTSTNYQDLAFALKALSKNA